MNRARPLMTFALAIAFLVLGVAAAAALPQIPADAFQPANGCGCHAGLLEDWQRSMHAKALDDPIYLLKLGEANRATDGALGPFCNSCHGPVATMSGQAADLENASEQSKQGVVCDFCHQVSGTTDPIGNVSQTMQADGTKRAQFDDSNSPAHATAYSAFHESSEFCGACHNVDHPADRALHLEATYTEWKESPYAEEGIQCQDCHMTPGPGVTKPYAGTAAAGGPQRDHIYLMTFTGANVALGNAEIAEENLKSAATLDLDVPEIVEPGSSIDISTVITNVGAGHYLPTGLTEVRQMWLEVTAVDGEGEAEVIGTHEFGTILRDAEGNAPVELWEAVAIDSDDRIAPRASVSDSFQYTMPEGGEVEIQAALYYRSCSEEMAEEAGVEVPTTTMVSATQAVYGSEGIAADAKSGDGGGAGSALQLVMALGGLLVAVGVVAYFVARSRKAPEA